MVWEDGHDFFDLLRLYLRLVGQVDCVSCIFYEHSLFPSFRFGAVPFCLPSLASVLFWSRLLSPLELQLSSLFTIHFTIVKTEAVGLLSRTVQSPNPVCWRQQIFSDLSQFWGWWDLHPFLTSPVSLSAMVLSTHLHVHSLPVVNVGLSNVFFSFVFTSPCHCHPASL